MPADLLPGAEPFAASNGPCGVLVLHGLTGTPASVRSLAECFADAGFSVEAPLLPGHGTSPEDLEETTFDDWLAAADAAYAGLAARCDLVAVAGLSMGGTLALALALAHADLAGLVLVNPFAKAPVPELVATLEAGLAGGARRIPSIGGDVARPGPVPVGYDATPVSALLSLFRATAALERRYGEISCPVLLLSSRVDHVVPTESGDYLVERLGGPVERVVLERSYHLATVDHDAAEVEARSVGFVQKLAAT
ncbi:MAG TPA: alpha/beta fold hydrolase [Acidimicrobiales bacterium]|nr:alpha/beta fold hydrolase [Acidimicrobiales bacterium]